MHNNEIEAHAEALANMTGDSFDVAEAEVRAMVAEGATYSAEGGWEWPTTIDTP